MKTINKNLRKKHFEEIITTAKEYVKTSRRAGDHGSTHLHTDDNNNDKDLPMDHSSSDKDELYCESLLSTLIFIY